MVGPQLTQYFYSPAQAASILGRGRTTVYKAIADGELKSVKHGRSRLVPAEAITEYAERLAASAS